MKDWPYTKIHNSLRKKTYVQCCIATPLSFGMSE